jgi:sigma-E factor negative regulatory protein RseB
VSRRKAPGWRAVSVAALLGLIGSGIAVLMLADSRAGPALGAGPSSADLAPRPASTASAAAAGIQLLQQAVAACQNTSYRGVQVVAWWGQGNATMSVVDVWHQPGRMTVVQSAGAGPSPGTDSDPPPGTAGYRDPQGILGVSPQLLDLLQSNYQVAYTGQGTAAGRAALVIQIRRPGAGVAARFFLDAATKLPLRREIFSSGSRLISVDAFTDLKLGSSGLGSAPALAAAPWGTQLGATALASLRAKGWPLPGKLPSNLMLFAATQTSTRSGKTVGLSYSDGLSVVSLFVQRGELAGPMPGSRQMALAGRTVYAIDPTDQGESSLSWSADGYVYTLIADAPAQTVSQVVAALPGNTPPGFWQRIGHGLHRLASWSDPLSH